MPLVIVDTSVWVEYLRTSNSVDGQELERLIRVGAVAMVGAVYAELVQGARDDIELRRLEEDLKAFPFLESTKETWQRAGRLLFDLRRRGLTLSLADALIATMALEGGHEVYTLDEHFRRVPGLMLHEAKKARDEE